MSLMRLLTTGRALNEIKSGGRYHLPKQSFLLPTFGREKNATEGESKQAEVKSGSFSCRSESAPTESKSAPASEPVLEKKTRRFGWLKRRNPFSGRPSPPAAANPGAGVVQAELSLDRVQVMRNDLSDADIEVVPRHSTEAAEMPAKRYMRSEHEPDQLGAKAWRWLGSRLFHAKHS